MSGFSILIPSDIGVTSLEDGFLRDYPSLSTFEIEQTFPLSPNPSITVIGRRTFDGAEKLKEISISGCKDLSQIADGAFERLKRLKFLSLDRNGFISIPYGPFQNMTLLTGLGLTGNSIYDVSPDAFKDLTQLEMLTLDHNNIRSLDATTF